MSKEDVYIEIRAGAVIEDNFCNKHIVKSTFKAKVKQQKEDFFVCKNDGRFISGLEHAISNQCIFVNAEDASIIS